MAYYNSYFPQQYYAGSQMPYNAPVMPSNTQQAQNNQITWVQGEAAAKAYPVAAGQSVLLMDSEDSVFYIKATDQSGMPQPLRVFEYTEKGGNVSAAKPAGDEYITRSEFDAFKEDMKKAVKGIRRPVIDGGEG